MGQVEPWDEWTVGWPEPRAEGTVVWLAGDSGFKALLSLRSSKPSWADQVEEEGGEDGE